MLITYEITLDNVLVIGSDKGYVYPFEITINPKDKKKVY